VRHIETDELWGIVGGPYTIGAGGTVGVNIRAVNTGPLEFKTADLWTIETPLAGWNDFTAVADIDPEDIGADAETDASLRQRREDELFAGGNDLLGIKAQVTKVTGVTVVAVFENRDCTQFVDGIPPGALEVVVEGGNDTEIAEAILSRKPPGAEAFGMTTQVGLVDQEGNPINIGITRPADIDIAIQIDVDTTGAEVGLVDNFGQLAIDVMLEFANGTAEIGQDVIPQALETPIWDLLRDPETGKFGATDVLVQVAIVPNPVATVVIPIDNRSRADFDSANITVNVIL
jgi:hypothetical protein